MVFTLRDRNIEKIGVIGSGQIGPDIALHFAKTLGPHGVEVVVVDVSEDALAAGKAKATKKINKGMETGAFKPAQGEAMLAGLRFTTNYDELADAGLIVEAATEDLGIKHKIFTQLEGLCSPEAILTSNSSHMEPEVIFEPCAHKQRTMVTHYFFPAERNPIVEVVPGADTDAAVTAWAMRLYEQIGKFPIEVKSRYGFAIDPIFEGLFQAAALGVEAGWGSVKQVDVLTKQALGQGIGPFTAMNLTGGNPLTAHGLDAYTGKIHAQFAAPQLLKDQLALGKPWDTARRGEEVETTPEQAAQVGRSMMGAYFGLVTEIVESGISNVADLEMAIPLSLVVRAPFAWMNKIGVGKALALVEAYAAEHEGFPVPGCLRRQAESGQPWEIPVVLRKDVDGVAVLTIRRPKVLNALNVEVFRQLRAHCEAAAADATIQGIVLTGFGQKAFVAGADIGMLSKLETAADGEASSHRFHATLDYIAGMTKPVVCAMNGFALGGGNELALACHARIAAKGLRMLAGQPEVNLGIIPGAGGTQRLPRLIGLAAAARMMRTANPISGAEALELGLISEEVAGDVVARAIEIVKDAAAGRLTLKPIQTAPLADVPAAFPVEELGHRSQRIDDILCRTILDGARLPLAEGLALECKAFGECVATKDMHIGMSNFLEHGPRAKAEFVNA